MHVKLHKPLFLLAFTLLLSACSSLPDQKIINSKATQLSQKNNSSTQALLQNAKLKIQKANTKLLAFYAPTYMEKAQESYNKAKELYADNAETKDIQLQSQLVMQYVESGVRNKKMVKEYLASSLNHRAVLEKLKTDTLFPAEFAVVTEQQLELIRQVEQRKEIEARNHQKAIIKAMKALEVKTIKHTYLSKTYTMLKQAESLKAAQHLPTIYQETLAQIKQIEAYISENPRKKTQINQYSQDSLFSAERLFSLSRLANQLENKQEGELENWIISLENQMQSISQAMQHDDIRNLSLADQSLILSQYGKKILKQNKYTSSALKQQKELAKWKRKVVLLEAEIKRLKRQSH
ncbi:hypothetical protein NBRC116188_09660 [Oceaniserpentilla sp. 4NH20-0058]|uniref:hypothetical protein n=1 Tax=Oceaniserpentilla sp. 4NH20-0058 TaxID=3127660 RepID=UPI003103353A